MTYGADIIFHDCETMNTSPAHAHYDQLIKYPDEIKRKMWLYHYQDDGLEKFDPVKDGFCGFVKNGQVFNF